MTVYPSMQALLLDAGSAAGYSCDGPATAALTMLSFIAGAKDANPALQGEIDAFIEANSAASLAAELTAA